MWRCSPRFFFSWCFDFPRHRVIGNYGMVLLVVCFLQLGRTSMVLLGPLVWSPLLVILEGSYHLARGIRFRVGHPCQGLHRLQIRVGTQSDGKAVACAKSAAELGLVVGIRCTGH